MVTKQCQKRLITQTLHLFHLIMSGRLPHSRLPPPPPGAGTHCCLHLLHVGSFKKCHSGQGRNEMQVHVP